MRERERESERLHSYREALTAYDVAEDVLAEAMLAGHMEGDTIVERQHALREAEDALERSRDALSPEEQAQVRWEEVD